MNSIIVVEDEELILELMVDVLELYGYTVRPFISFIPFASGSRPSPDSSWIGP